MIQLRTILDVADNTGAKRASMIGVLGKKNCSWAEIGDIINVNIKESAPEAATVAMLGKPNSRNLRLLVRFRTIRNCNN